MPELSDKQLRARRPVKLHAMPPRQPAAVRALPALPDYAELHCLTNFSFQRGASRPEELVTQAYHLGYRALAITDECSVAGIVRAHVALRDHPQAMADHEHEHPEEPPLSRNPDFRLLFGSEFRFERFTLVAIAHDLQGWGNLCEFITAARTTEAPKGEYRVSWQGSDVASLRHCEILLVPHRTSNGMPDLEAISADVVQAKGLYGDHLWIAVELFNEMDDDLWLVTLEAVGDATGVPLVAAGDVHMHARSRKPLQDVMTAVRLGKPVAECGFALQPNAERHLRHRMRLATVYPEELLERTLEVADRCSFSPRSASTGCMSCGYITNSPGVNKVPAWPEEMIRPLLLTPGVAATEPTRRAVPAPLAEPVVETPMAQAGEPLAVCAVL